MRLALEQDGDVVAVHLDADRLLESDRTRLMGGLLEHGSEAEELSLRGFIDHDFLVILVDGGHPDHARDDDVGTAARIAHLVDALAGSELLDFDLAGENGGFFVVEQGKERNLSQDFGIAGHGRLPDKFMRGKATTNHYHRGHRGTQGKPASV